MGNERIGYARKIPEDTMLPFYEESCLPSLKGGINLSGVANVTAQGDNLLIEFVP
jgi:hypothetical protein